MMSVTRRVAKANLPTRYGTFEMFVYGTPDHEEHVALTLGAIDDGEPVLVRAHSEPYGRRLRVVSLRLRRTTCR